MAALEPKDHGLVFSPFHQPKGQECGQMIPETHSCNFPAFLESTYLTIVSTSVIAKYWDLKLSFVPLPHKLYETITISEHGI